MPNWRSTESTYGLGARSFHWILALLLAVLFGLGWWMTGLSYYDAWYKRAFDLHKALGIVAFAIILLRVNWRLLDHAPRPIGRGWQRSAAGTAHVLLYMLMVAVPITGYLMSTADGRGVSVFGLFTLPAVLPAADGREEWAGAAHYYLAFGGAWLVLLHVAATAKHHFIDRDDTLRRMLTRRSH